VVYVEEQDDTSEALESVEFVLEKKQMQENSQELENQAGKIQK